MSSVTTPDGTAVTAQYGTWLAVGATAAVATISAICIYSKRYTQKIASADLAQKVKAAAQVPFANLIKNRVVTKVTTQDATYKYQVGLRDEDKKTVVAAFYLTVANSNSLASFLNTDSRLVKAGPQHLARVTDFEICIASNDEGFAKPELATRLTERFPNLTTVSLVAPKGTVVLGSLEPFVDALAAKKIKVLYKVAQQGEISAE